MQTLQVDRVRGISAAILDSVGKYYVGKRLVLRKLLAASLSNGHVLFEDFPGLGKTLLAKIYSRVTGCQWKRVQFTPDLMPADILGTRVWRMRESRFVLERGPIFTNILLADEINRSPPKTQSALLEAMEERQVTIEGDTHRLTAPFLVIATQNPIEYHGTFPLPESQLDRFMMHIKLGYPALNYEKQVVVGQTNFDFIESFEPVISSGEIIKMQKEIDTVQVDESLVDYLMSIISATRENSDIRLGVSPRGSQFLLKAAKAHAYYEGRDYVVPSDIKEPAPLVLGHRIILKTRSYISDAEKVIEDIINKIPVPL